MAVRLRPTVPRGRNPLFRLLYGGLLERVELPEPVLDPVPTSENVAHHYPVRLTSPSVASQNAASSQGASGSRRLGLHGGIRTHLPADPAREDFPGMPNAPTTAPTTPDTPRDFLRLLATARGFRTGAGMRTRQLIYR